MFYFKHFQSSLLSQVLGIQGEICSSVRKSRMASERRVCIVNHPVYVYIKNSEKVRVAYHLRDQTFHELLAASNTSDKFLDSSMGHRVATSALIRIVPTKKAEEKVMKEFLAGRQTVSFASIDEVQNGVVWMPAGPRVSMKLNSRCYEYQSCELYLHAVPRMTYNERRGSHPFSQGQIAILVELPPADQVMRDVHLKLKLAPAGTRYIADPTRLPDSWPEVVVRAHTTPEVVVGAGLQMGRRTQRFYVCSTIHRIQVLLVAKVLCAVA